MWYLVVNDLESHAGTVCQIILHHISEDCNLYYSLLQEHQISYSGQTITVQVLNQISTFWIYSFVYFTWLKCSNRNIICLCVCVKISCFKPHTYWGMQENFAQILIWHWLKVSGQLGSTYREP
jgi:hypothetical protein